MSACNEKKSIDVFVFRVNHSCQPSAPATPQMISNRLYVRYEKQLNFTCVKFIVNLTEAIRSVRPEGIACQIENMYHFNISPFVDRLQWCDRKQMQYSRQFHTSANNFKNRSENDAKIVRTINNG